MRQLFRDAQTHPDDQALAWLRSTYTGYRIWRSVRYDGRYGDWAATLHDKTAGVGATVIRPTAEALDEALTKERARASERAAGRELR